MNEDRMFVFCCFAGSILLVVLLCESWYDSCVLYVCIYGTYTHHKSLDFFGLAFGVSYFLIT
jgi:hypothetical protein